MPGVAQCRIVAHEEIAEAHCRIEVHAPEIAASAQAGQFAMIEATPALAPFLRRPMSFSRIGPDTLVFLFKIEGEGTRLLAEKRPGQTLSIQGPLGNGFAVNPGCPRHIVAAGGIGVAPLPALAETIRAACGQPPEIVLAARSRRLLLCKEEFQQMGCPVHLATEDGSAGEKALAHELLERLNPIPGDQVYACGPMPMLRAVSVFTGAVGVNCQVSLEAQMACGAGVCLGCVVESKRETEGEKMLRVCKEGPVIDAALIDWNAHNLAYDR